MTGIYFKPGSTWSDRLAAFCGGLTEFENANREVVQRCLKDDQLRVVINLPADALLALLGGDHYRNCYELPFVAGEVRAPSPKRMQVDGLLGFQPDGRDYYFAAVSFGGTGVRFYGEYCMVISPGAVKEPRILDRNSYELLDEPLRQNLSLVAILGGNWGDLSSVLTLKVLTTIRQPNRLLPPGVVSETVLRDEDFVEVHLRQKIFRQAVEEIRQAPEDLTRDSHLRQQLARGQMPRPEELLWSRHRHDVDVATARIGVNSRIVTTSGRGGRWK